MSTPQQRNDQLDDWLRRQGSAAAQAGSDAPGGDCLDADTAGAWADGMLAGAALERAERHTAGCDRCQTLMATLLDTMPDTTVPGAVPRREWWRGWLNWAVPLAATATAALALIVWLNQPSPRDSVVQAPATTMARQEAEPGLPRLDAAPPPAGAQPTDSAPGAVPRESVQGFAAPADRRDQAAASDALAKAEPASPATTAQRSRESVQSQAPAAAAEPADKALADANAAARPAAAAPPASPPAAGQVQALAETAVTPAARALATTRDAPVLVRSTAAAASQWRLTGSQVERSVDGGASWQATPTGTSTALLAGASPANAVCWIVGRAGTVLRTVDGTTWTRLRFPSGADLVAVSSASADTATITTADGAVYQTSDAGATWVVQRP